MALSTDTSQAHARGRDSQRFQLDKVHFDAVPNLEVQLQSRCLNNRVWQTRPSYHLRFYLAVGFGLVERSPSDLAHVWVQAMGGQFKVESALGSGTTFRFTVQLEAGPGAALEAGEGASGALAGRRCLLLVLNRSTADILQEQLSAWGMRCMHAATVAAAQHALKEQVRAPTLPGMGSEILRRRYGRNGLGVP